MSSLKSDHALLHLLLVTQSWSRKGDVELGGARVHKDVVGHCPVIYTAGHTRRFAGHVDGD